MGCWRFTAARRFPPDPSRAKPAPATRDCAHWGAVCLLGQGGWSRPYWEDHKGS